MTENVNSYTRRLSRAIDTAYEAYKSGEPDSDERLIDAFSAQARNVVVHEIGSDDPTLEQGISHRAFLALKKFRGKSKLSTWFYRIAQNDAKRELGRRIRDRKLHVPIDAGEDDEDEREIQVAAKPVNHDARLDLQKLRVGLPTEQDKILRLLEDGHTLEEIATLIGEPVGTIRSRYRLAKKKMSRRGKKE